MQVCEPQLQQPLSRGRRRSRSSAGHTRARAPSAVQAGRGWWPALANVLPHVKPHVGTKGCTLI